MGRHKIARGTMKRIPRVVALILGSAVVWMLLGLYVLPLWFGVGTVAILPLGMLFTTVGILVYLNIPGWLTIGRDGVLIDWRGSDRRYVAFHEMVSARVYTEPKAGKVFIGVELAMREEGPLQILVGEDQFGADKRTARLQSQVQLALDAFTARDGGGDSSLLARGDRSPKDWLTRLRSLAAGANAGPREAAMPADRLWRIVEDPGALPSARAAAAAALAAELDQPSRDRLRVTAADAAAPGLRVAIEAAAAGDEQRLMEALAEMERQADVEHSHQSHLR